MNNIPKKIYLQLGEAASEFSDFNDLMDATVVTWSPERSLETDLVYKLQKTLVPVEIPGFQESIDSMSEEDKKKVDDRLLRVYENEQDLVKQARAAISSINEGTSHKEALIAMWITGFRVKEHEFKKEYAHLFAPPVTP